MLNMFREIKKLKYKKTTRDIITHRSHVQKNFYRIITNENNSAQKLSLGRQKDVHYDINFDKR